MGELSSKPSRLFRSALIGKHPKRTALRALLLILISFSIFQWALVPVRNQTEAMAPRFQKGHLVWVSPLVYLWQEPTIGDPIAIRLAGQNVVHLSRVIAMPGQIVELKESQIYVDGKALPGGLLQLPEQVVQTGYKSKVVEADEVFVMGDVRDRSIEELHAQGSFGRVKTARILGKILF